MAQAPGSNLRFWLKGYLFLGVAVLSLAMFFYSNHLISRMQANAQATSRLFSRYMSSMLFQVSDDGSLADLRAVVQDSDLPIIITVLGGVPILWHNVPVDERTQEDFDMLINMDVNNPPTPKLKKLVELYREYDKTNKPIPIQVVGAPPTDSYVHFGQSALQRELRYMPFVMLAIFLAFMGVAIQGLRYLKLSEQRSIWVGMARETAHQLGTPLSAMLGWVHVLKDHAETRGDNEMAGYVSEMEVDLARLNKITERFSKIGATPELVVVDLKPVLERTVAYFHKRLPTLNSTSTLSLSVDSDVRVRGNEELLEWVFENLVKNAIDSLGESGGRIEIDARHAASEPMVDVTVRDTGRGIPGALRDLVFRPGFTTKRRGWGLGLALARRIVAEYHGGSIRLAESKAGKGTTFVVRLPAA
ncbi:MAG TPA: HAMP domain-containing sensor histidine kinase [Candidatus Krumholzibacteria bacterium]|nr:HAMP domain-containing sensor histidine kinase [Candidatus Krumholzibacteria bacterium]